MKFLLFTAALVGAALAGWMACEFTYDFERMVTEIEKEREF